MSTPPMPIDSEVFLFPFEHTGHKILIAYILLREKKKVDISVVTIY